MGTPIAQFLSPQPHPSTLSPNGHNHSRATSSATNNLDFSPGSASNDMPPLGGNFFNQPFVPQDLWQMPMTLEWDWAGMTDYGGGSGGMEEMGPSVGGGLETSGVISGLPTSGPWVQERGGDAGS